MDFMKTTRSNCADSQYQNWYNFWNGFLKGGGGGFLSLPSPNRKLKLYIWSCFAYDDQKKVTLEKPYIQWPQTYIHDVANGFHDSLLIR